MSEPEALLDVEDEEELDEDEVELEDAPEPEEPPSIDLLEESVVGGRSGPVIEDDDAFIVRAMEQSGEEPQETLTIKVKPKTAGEFTCTECFLVRSATQLAPGETDVCVDCA